MSVIYVRKTVSLMILLLGVFSLIFSSIFPSALQYAFMLFYFSSFAGLLYVYFQPESGRRLLVVLLFSVIIIFEALNIGMFTVFAYMGITLFSFLVLGKKYGIVRKVSFLFLGIILLLFIQTVKQGYRKKLWDTNYKGNAIALFATVAKDELTNNSFTNWKTYYFPIYYRTNQGFNLMTVMRRFPKKVEFDGGSQLFINIFSSFVPRVLWPDKPEAGGVANMKYYAGLKIKGWSTNVGPIGEAYASFGPRWGVVFMMLLALFIRFVYFVVFRYADTIPLLIFWIPVLFYQVTYSAEADTLQIFNSLIKSTFFIWLLYKFLPSWFARNPRVANDTEPDWIATPSHR